MSYYKLCWENDFNHAIDLINTSQKKNAALRVFSYNGNFDAVKKLLELGANPLTERKKYGHIFIDCTKGTNMKFDYEKSAIELAAMNNMSDIVILFIENNN